MTNLVEVKVTENNKGIAVFNVDLGLTLTDVTIEYDVTLTESGSIIAMGLNRMTIKNQKGEFNFVSDGNHGFKGVGRGRKPNSIIDIAVTSLDVVETEMILGSFDSEIFESFYVTEETQETSVTETTNTNKLGKEVDCMKIEGINTVYYKKNTAIVTFTKGDVVAKFEVERLGDSGMLTFSLKTAKYGYHEYEQKKGYHTKIKGVGRGRKPQNITQIVQEAVEEFATAMDNKNSNEYKQIMATFSNTDKLDKLEEQIINANTLDESVETLYNALVETQNDDLMENIFSITELECMLECQGLSQDEIQQQLNKLTENANASYFIDVEGCYFRAVTETDLLDIIQKLHSNI